MSFLKDLDKALKEGENKKKQRENDPNFRILPKVSLLDKIHGIKGAFKRIKDKALKDGLNSVWIDEKEAIERSVCCTTCTDGATCPYCGCQIKKSWFFPLGKSEVTTEGCPNPNTYPHLKNFPPKNYWQVCLKKTSIIFLCNSIINLNKFIDNINENCTGNIEILIGLKVNNDKERIEIQKQFSNNSLFFYSKNIKEAIILDDLVNKSTGDYLLFIKNDGIFDYGLDTKLKCISENNRMATCLLTNIDENNNFGKKIYENFRYDENDDVLRANDGSTNREAVKIEEIKDFNKIIYMIKKEDFKKNNINNILIRTDCRYGYFLEK